MELTTLKHQRGTAKAAITRIATYLATVDRSNVKVTELKYKRLLAEQAHKKFDELQDQIEEHLLADDAALKAEMSERIEIEDKLVAVVSEIDNIIEDRTAPQLAIASSSSSVALPTASSIPTHKSIKLPPITLTTFSGNYTKWTEFKDTYESTIHTNPTLSEVQKFQYLKSQVKDEAASIIKNIQITSNAYNEAWSLLKQKYDNTREIVFCNIRKLFNISHVKNSSPTQLQQLLNQTNECVLTLKVLQQPIDKWDSILVHMTTERFDNETRKQWALQLTGTELPTYNQLCTFMEQHIRGLEAYANSSHKHSEKRVHTHFSSSSNSNSCFLCKGEHHPLYRCSSFLKMTVEQRSSALKAASVKVCFNCLLPTHKVGECNSSSTCRKCGEKHNTLLHFNRSSSSQSKGGVASASVPTVNSSHTKINTNVLLATAVVQVRNSIGSSHQCRVFLGSGSQGTLVTESFVQALGLPRKFDKTLVSGVAGVDAGFSRGKVDITLYSNISNASINITALVMSSITSEMPSYPCKQDWDHLRGIQLADTEYYKPAPVDILIGCEYIPFIQTEGKIVGTTHSPVATNTIFGWALSGRVTVQQVHSVRVNHLQCETEQIVQKFWELEQVPTPKFYSAEEKAAEEHFISTHFRDNNGRYGVCLPTNNKIKQLGLSRDMAVRRWKSVEKRLSKNQQWKEDYNKFMKEFISLGHMVRIPTGEAFESLGETFYLPHHFVTKPDSTTTKFRVVFDGSAKSSTNISLNNCLLVGATLQDDIFTLLLRFRIHCVVFKADITKMFRQFSVSEKDSNLQRIVWRENENDQIQDYRLTTVTYGTASAPFLATRCLKQLAEDSKHQYPTGAAILNNDFYVDDLMGGEESSKKAIKIYKELNSIAESAQLSLCKWATNNQEFLNIIPEDKRDSSGTLSFDDNSSLKALGLKWNPSSDNFSFNNIQVETLAKCTKRSVLSQTAQVFDPLGLISPVIIIAKLFLQQLWKQELPWDEQLPQPLIEQWQSYCKNLSKLDSIQIPRWVQNNKVKSCELHCFSDASERAYGAVIYVRCLNEDGSYSSKMLTSKSCVTAMKQISLPRLELCGAVLLVQLLSSVISSLKTNYEFYCYTDSMIVLHWLAAHPNRWQTFVANRVAIIQETCPFEKWNHVKSEDNPADLISRGTSVAQLQSSELWWNGPSWLSSSSLPPKPDAFSNVDTRLLEERKPKAQVFNITINEPFINKFKEFSKLVRFVSYIYRLQRFARTKVMTNGILTVDESSTARLELIQIVQHQQFGDEIKRLTNGESVKSSSALSTLNPFLDSNKVLRVGGRLQKSELPLNSKHQVILPDKSHLTKLLISHSHLVNLHSGAKSTWAYLRRDYWIINARNSIRFLIRKCMVCRRNRAESMKQLMGSLPSSRVTPGRVFQEVGVDYAGPYKLINKTGRGAKSYKAYFCIFVCMATKAIHLEAVNDLTTDSFIATLRRFANRRGKPTTIFSDCGTNFVGADKELQKLVQCQQHNDIMSSTSQSIGIQWKFNVPGNPHAGGLWEAGVKSVKYHLRRVTGDHPITYEEFITLLSQIEAILNSRPLCALTADPEDYDVLTPGHFIIGEPLTAIPDPDVTTIKINKLSRWQYVQQVSQHFWKRWSNEYLSTLQQRFKWKEKRDNINVGDLVVIHEEGCAPTRWKLGRVLEVHQGDDNCVRKVSLKTATGVLKRPVVKLTPILFSSE